MPVVPSDHGCVNACGALPCIPKARANTSHLLSDPLSKGHTLLDGGGQGVGEGGLVVHERIIERPAFSLAN